MSPLHPPALDFLPFLLTDFFTVAWTWYSPHHFNLNVELRLRFAEVWDDQLGLPGAVGYLAGVCLCQHSSSPDRLGNSSDHK